MRTGATHDHYERQKNQQFAYFRVSSADARAIAASQFTIYNFITNSFAFSPTKKELTLRILENLRETPLSFQQLVRKLQAKKSTAYLLCLALERSGLIERDGRNAPYRLSNVFAASLREYAAWWEKWTNQ